MLEPPHEDALRPDWRGALDERDPLGSREQLLADDARLEPRERCPDAEVGPAPEAQVLLGMAAVEPQLVGRIDVRGVAVRGRPEQHQAVARCEREAAELALAPLTLPQLIAALGRTKSVLTFTGVPPGSGKRLGIDRDANGTLDGDERRE